MIDRGGYDLLVVGGGINGAGIARDAAGRGLRVLLCEQDDLGNHTSSASTKLIHGGLRYLEHHEFRLVREALRERERLLRLAPHIIWPLRFILPHDRHLRPAWMIRAGLFLYDHLGGRETLPASKGIKLHSHTAGAPLQEFLRKGFLYSDCWVQDARLVVLNAMDAAANGAQILTGTRCERLERNRDHWRGILHSSETGIHSVRAKCVVNAAGPWAGNLFDQVLHRPRPGHLRLVKGSHIVVPRLFDHPNAYIFQNSDHRIVFAIPFEGDFTLIGTTDVDFVGDPASAAIASEETEYLCAAVNQYFRAQVRPHDVIWSYSGVRPLYANNAGNAASVTRDYVLELDEASDRAPLLSVFGGKLTTYRCLAEHALDKLQQVLQLTHKPWSSEVPLPGGDIQDADFEAFLTNLRARRPWLPIDTARRLARNYGTRVERLLGDARRLEDLGQCFGADLYAREVDYLVNHEWARSADDILWRRTKLGLRLDAGEKRALANWLQRRVAA